METIVRIQLAYCENSTAIKRIARELDIARNAAPAIFFGPQQLLLSWQNRA
jgi:hypothetical protein